MLEVGGLKKEANTYCYTFKYEEKTQSAHYVSYLANEVSNFAAEQDNTSNP